MRTRIICLTAAAAVTAAGLVALSSAQQPPAPTVPSQAPPAPLVHHLGQDVKNLKPLPLKVYFSARTGAAWLQRANRIDGTFSYVSTPALWGRSKPEPYLRQAAATVALARAAHHFGDEHAAALATQTTLRLLLDTAADNPKAPQCRYPTAPAVNRLAAAGLIIRAISELPAAQADLLEQAELLCRYLYRQQRPDGSLSASEPPTTPGADEPDWPAAEALHGVLRSCQQRPAPWKLDMARKALAFYQPRWRAKRNLTDVPRFSAVYAEAFALTKEQAFADAVFEMNDWLCQFQYTQVGPHLGGFMGCADGKPQATPPDVSTARHVEALAEACRAARQAGDARRHPRYLEALELALPFLMSLQFGETNTRHFSEPYRHEIVGAFFASHQDGDLRLDYSQQAVAAMLQYLAHEGAAR